MVLNTEEVLRGNVALCVDKLDKVAQLEHLHALLFDCGEWEQDHSQELRDKVSLDRRRLHLSSTSAATRVCRLLINDVPDVLNEDLLLSRPVKAKVIAVNLLPSFQVLLVLSRGDTVSGCQCSYLFPNRTELGP